METTKEIIGFKDLGFWVRGLGAEVGFVVERLRSRV